MPFTATRAGAAVPDWLVGGGEGAAEWAASVFPLALALALALATGSSVLLAPAPAGVEWGASAPELLALGEGFCGGGSVDFGAPSPSPLRGVVAGGSAVGVTVVW